MKPPNGCSRPRRAISAIRLWARLPYLRLVGTVTGGWLLARGALGAAAALADTPADPAYLSARITVARFYAEHELSQAGGLVTAITRGAESALALADEHL